MTLALLLTCGVACLPQDPPPAFVEVQPQKATAWLHEPIEVLVRIGVDPAFFAAQAVPLFQRRLDQPFHVTVPWLQGAEDRAVEFVPPAAAATQRIAVGDEVLPAVAAGRREQGGRTFELLELRYRWLPLAAGTSTIAPVELRYAFASRFRDDFLRGRQPEDRQEQSVLSAAAQLQVKGLPTAGRPAGWNGAVGDFTVSAAASVATVAAGGTFALEIAVAGRGNLDRFAPMASPSLPGFHVQGMVERRAAASRTFVFDVLALREGATAVPPVTFAAFSPARGDYVTLVTDAVPIAVVATPAGVVLPERVRELIAADARAARAPTPWWWYALAVGFCSLLWNLQRTRRRRAVRARSLASARAAVDAVAGGEPAALLAAFEVLCARCAGDEAFASDTTWQALGMVAPAEVAAAARRVHAALDAARYGGTAVPEDEIQRVAASLHRAR